jgi:hypothetical protein
MHSVVFSVDMKDPWDGDREAELGSLVESCKDMPGFVRGTWLTNGSTGLSLLVFDSEETAQAVAASAAIPPSASVTLRAADVYEVAAET